MIIPAGIDTLTVCHWTNEGTWVAITVSHRALSGHEQHYDAWPPIDGVTPGHNWPQGEQLYLNGCVLPAASPAPTASETAVPSASASASPSASESLPPTGPVEILAQVALAAGLILTGAWCKWLRPR